MLRISSRKNFMKSKIILLLSIIFISTSCYEYCPYCGNYGYCDCCTHHNPTITYTRDYFCAETLIGTWQIEYNANYKRGLGIEPKQIKFFDERKCDITYSEGNDPTWYTETYNYTYASGFIRFDKGRNSFAFKYRDFIFPELYVQDSFGNYKWRKVRSGGC